MIFRLNATVNLRRVLFIFKRFLKNNYDYYFIPSNQPFSIYSCPKLEINTHELGQFVWHRLLPIVGTNPYPPNELMLMCAAVLWLRPKLIIEWKTHIGVSARIFHEVNTRYKIGVEIHSSDLPNSISHVEHPGPLRGILVHGLPVHLHIGDGATVAASLLREKGVMRPLIFIDGDHRKESVIKDACTVLEIAPKAGLLFHDTYFQPTADYNRGPYDAIQEILKEFEVSGKYFQVIYTGLGRPGMTFIIQE